MGTHPFGYITIIVIQQLVLVGLLFGIGRLFQEHHRLRSRLTRIRIQMGGAEMNPAKHIIASPQLQELLFEPGLEQPVETGARVLASVDG